MISRGQVYTIYEIVPGLSTNFHGISKIILEFSQIVLAIYRIVLDMSRTWVV